MSQTTYTPSIIVPYANVNKTYETLDLISQAASLVPSTSNAAIINQWITKMIRTKTPTSGVQPFWSNVNRYTTLTTIVGASYIGGVTAQDGRVFMSGFGLTNTGVFNNITRSFTTISGSPTGFAGGVLLPNGIIMLTPYAATVIGLINPVLNTYTAGPSGVTNYMGACLLPDGRVVMSPTGSQKLIGVYNPATNTFTSYTGNGWQGVGTTYPYDGVCLIPDGRAIFAPTNGLSHIGIFNYLTNSFTSVPTTVGQSLSSPVYHPNGNVYMSPQATPNIGIFNTRSNVFTTFSGITTGLRGSCLLPDGRIMFSPVSGSITFTNIYNPYTNSLTTITGLPVNSFLGCTVLQDGRVLMVPWSSALGIISGGIPPSPDMTVHPFFNKF
jgi:streptogramin lyase